MSFFSKSSSGKPVILVVDDSPVVVLSIKTILEPAGYEVLEALDGAQGLNLAQKRRPQLILLDMMMPGIDGVETLSRLKNNPATADIPVLMVTGSQTGKDVEKAFGYGATGYLVKPVESERLLNKIRATLSPQRPGS
ncbi:MAG: response regulator [Elusimicrobiota bacterium]